MYGQLMEGGKQFVHCREVVLIGVSIIGGFTAYTLHHCIYIHYIIARQSTVVYACMYIIQCVRFSYYLLFSYETWRESGNITNRLISQ